MKNFQRMRCEDGTTRFIRYCVATLGASLILLGALGCSPDDPGAPEQSALVEEAAEPLPSHEASSDQRRGVEPRSNEPGDASAARGSAEEQPVVVFLGTSLTAGYGLREAQAFPALIQAEIQAAGLPHRVINAGVSGDTSAGGLRRLDWLLRLPISVLVLELGANDMLRGLSVTELEKNLETIIERTATANPTVRFLIAGMRAAPNLGSEYREAFDRIYPALAKRHHASLIPFLLEDVAAKRNLNQADGIHPTAEGHSLIAALVWKHLAPIIGEN